jgi:hypothetical protein
MQEREGHEIFSIPVSKIRVSLRTRKEFLSSLVIPSKGQAGMENA